MRMNLSILAMLIKIENQAYLQSEGRDFTEALFFTYCMEIDGRFVN